MWNNRYPFARTSAFCVCSLSQLRPRVRWGQGLCFISSFWFASFFSVPPCVFKRNRPWVCHATASPKLKNLFQETHFSVGFLRNNQCDLVCGSSLATRAIEPKKKHVTFQFKILWESFHSPSSNQLNKIRYFLYSYEHPITSIPFPSIVSTWRPKWRTSNP